MFSLAALGAGLGQFAQDYRQQQESAMRQMQARLLMQQYQREQQGRQLMGQALMAGGIPGFGSPQQNPMQQIAGIGGGQPMSPPPAAGMQLPSSAPAPAAPPQQQAGPRTLSEDQQDAMELNGGQEMSPEQTDAYYRLAGAGQSRAGVPLEPPPAAGTSATDATGVTTNTQDTPLSPGAAAAAPVSAAAAPPSVDVADHNELTQIMGMFRYTDPSAIAARIKDIRPDADPEAVAYATEQLYKMSSGNLREQLAAANMYKYLRGENWQREKFAAQLPLKQADLTIKKGNLTERQKTQSRLSAQFGEKVQQFTSKLAEARAKTSAQDRRGALEGLRKNIEKQLYPPFGTPGPTEEEKPVLQRQLNEVVNEMRKSAGMKPLPTPGAPAQPPSE